MLTREGWILMSINDNIVRMMEEAETHAEITGDTYQVLYNNGLKTWVMWMKAKDLFECEECTHIWEAHELSNCPKCNSKYTSTVEDD